jgi:GTP:adenosylcobinamide-phosphate guanylyltransferase
MAASRRGADDPVARLQGRSDKSLVEVDGQTMVGRVVDVLYRTQGIERVFVSVENAAVLREDPALAAQLDSGKIVAVESRATLADSVFAAIPVIAAHLGRAPYPLLITTADNVLHTPEIVDAFCKAATGGDIAIGITPAATVLAKYPTGQRAFHHFRDADWSGCNIYMLRTPEAARAARAFAGGGQFGKKPWRLIKAFGLWTFLLHYFRLLTMEQAMARIGRAFNLDVRAARLPFAEAPIDVDNAADHTLATEILQRRNIGAG